MNREDLARRLRDPALWGNTAQLLTLCEQAASALTAAPPRTDAPALTDEQCDAVYEELHEWASDIDSYDFGLPQYAGGGKEAGREVIRRALRTATKPTGVQKHG